MHLPSPWRLPHTDSFFVLFPEDGLWSGGYSVHTCGSMTGRECQGFNALGVTPTSVGQKLVDKYPGILLPQWTFLKCTSHTVSKVPREVGPQLPTLFPVSCSHCLAVFPGIASRMNSASKSLSQALPLGEPLARDPMLHACRRP